MTLSWLSAIASAVAMLVAFPCQGRVLQVGAARVLKVPSQAATVAGPGDVVRIDPGTYADCAVWRAPRLVIEAAGPGVVLAGKVCAETATFIVLGNDTVITGLTFAGAAGAGHNAAAIKGLGVNLTVQECVLQRFTRSPLRPSSRRAPRPSVTGSLPLWKPTQWSSRRAASLC